ncbi:PIG-L family deacetylase [Paenibacillus chondroitinus]|uniref:PIG-L family deacetylase n=1 Tax=Paenibacillus chondroitinus TaxID=59842 RepID=A0ABU6DBM7_9BACL|nr:MULTISPECIES: PIG-L family deacetylase [Paenibacillus]MCY9662285.1 PIG-L family deacetylase [Paenibacillus anseongense]MEB4794677.1 PIG-L family deacetylase [Paenibacillus chondroitinus]
MKQEIRVIVIGAHPDEPDIYAGGTAALFAALGHKVKFLSLTDGCGGHYELPGPELVTRRKKEADEAAKRLGIVEYEVLSTHDGELFPDVTTRNEVIRHIRRWQADVVITFHPAGGTHPDNRYAGHVVSDAVPFSALKNAVIDVPALERTPVVLLMPDYSMKDRYQADVVIDIEAVLEKKLLACDAHASQFYEFSGKNEDREVPQTWEEKREYLLKYWAPFFYVSDEMRAGLEKWYGAERAAKITYAEPFEIANYGRKVDDEELKKWFPMLG